jgi:hypothetical protein
VFREVRIRVLLTIGVFAGVFNFSTKREKSVAGIAGRQWLLFWRWQKESKARFGIIPGVLWYNASCMENLAERFHAGIRTSKTGGEP